jgi:hypothetical protein
MADDTGNAYNDSLTILAKLASSESDAPLRVFLALTWADTLMESMSPEELRALAFCMERTAKVDASNGIDVRASKKMTDAVKLHLKDRE